MGISYWCALEGCNGSFAQPVPKQSWLTHQDPGPSKSKLTSDVSHRQVGKTNEPTNKQTNKQKKQIYIPPTSSSLVKSNDYVQNWGDKSNNDDFLCCLGCTLEGIFSLHGLHLFLHNVYIYIHISTHKTVYIYIYMCVCQRVQLYIMYLHVYIIKLYIYIYVCIRQLLFTEGGRHSVLHTTYIYIYIYINIYQYVYIYICIYISQLLFTQGGRHSHSQHAVTQTTGIEEIKLKLESKNEKKNRARS